MTVVDFSTQLGALTAITAFDAARSKPSPRLRH
jgi:hypothetical protein